MHVHHDRHKPFSSGKRGELGALKSGVLRSDFTVHNTDPGHWLAIGVVCAATMDAPMYTPHMLVGAGSSRTDAVSDLQRRVNELAAIAND